MSWFNSFLVAALTGVVGLFSAGFVAAAYAQWYNVSNREGAGGYMIVGVAILGGLAGGVLGLVMARVLANAGFWKATGCSLGLVLGLAALVTLLFYLFADLPPKLDGHELRLQVEIKLPAGQAKPTGEGAFTLGSVSNQRQRAAQPGDLHLDQARRENDRWIVPVAAHLFTTRGRRTITAEVAKANLAGFIISLPARPDSAFEQWSEWLPQPRAGESPWPESKAAYRFRVQRILPPPPEPTEAEVKAREFAALKPDAPLEQWLPFLFESPNAERTAVVIQRINERQGELAKLIGSPDERMREHALSSTKYAERPAPEVTEAVLAEGRAIAAGIRTFNELKADDPKFHALPGELRMRFNHWKQAWWSLSRRLDLDTRPPVQEIHDLATVRARDTGMDEIEVNARAILEELNRSAREKRQ